MKPFYIENQKPKINLKMNQNQIFMLIEDMQLPVEPFQKYYKLNVFYYEAESGLNFPFKERFKWVDTHRQTGRRRH